MRKPFLALLSAAFLALSAAPVRSEGLQGIRTRITWTGILANYPGTSKIIDGTKVYTEGTPLLAVKLADPIGDQAILIMPYAGDKAKAIFDAARSVPADQEVVVYFSPSQKSARTGCRNYAEPGCIELGTPNEEYVILGMLAYPAPG